MKIGILILIGTAGLLLFWAMHLYNVLVALRVRGSNAWSDIDVQLKRRHDLVPNLVAVVQGYASHEKEVLEKVASYRASATAARGPAAGAAAEADLALGIRSLFAVAEAYPQLLADQGFRKLQDQLSEIETNIQHARRYYNAVVRDMNTAVETVPNSLIAGLLGFRKMEYFQAQGDERDPSEVIFKP